MDSPESDAKVVTLDGIDQVYSHPLVLDQCTRFLDELRDARQQILSPKSRSAAAKGDASPSAIETLTVHAVDDTAGSIVHIQQRRAWTAAVVASPQVAQFYPNIRILKEDVGDLPFTATRFLVLAPSALSNSTLSAAQHRGGCKTSLAVCLKNSPGALVRALSCFALRDINVAKIESRPSPRALNSFSGSGNVWEYVNYIDVEGGTAESSMRNALANLQEFATQVKILGSYPKSAGTSSSSSYGSLGGAYGM